MKKIFLRALAGIMACWMLFLTVGAVEINNESEKVFIFDGNVPKEKALLIEAAISGEEIIQPRNIICIFGHSLALTGGTEIIHRHRTAAPRCLRNSYDIYYCTRLGCNYITYTTVGSVYIFCCS
jgi:hypothetical protein